MRSVLNKKPRGIPGALHGNIASYAIAGADVIIGTPTAVAAGFSAACECERVSRWTKWYGGQGPESCMLHSRIMALVVANLFW